MEGGWCSGLCLGACISYTLEEHVEEVLLELLLLAHLHLHWLAAPHVLRLLLHLCSLSVALLAVTRPRLRLRPPLAPTLSSFLSLASPRSLLVAAAAAAAATATTPPARVLPSVSKRSPSGPTILVLPSWSS